MRDDVFDAFIKNTLKKNTSGATDDDVQDYLDSSYFWARDNYLSAADWTAETVRILRIGPSKISDEKFFINLCGTISDLNDFLEEKSSLFVKLKVDESEIPDFIASNKDAGMRKHHETMWTPL